MFALLEKAAGPLGRHAAQFGAVVILLWQIGQPWAADFVREQVDDRISKLEEKQAEISILSQAQSQRLSTVQSDLDKVLNAQQQQQQLLIDILRNVKQ